jgi:hypothetical protein
LSAPKNIWQVKKFLSNSFAKFTWQKPNWWTSGADSTGRAHEETDFHASSFLSRHQTNFCALVFMGIGLATL